MLLICLYLQEVKNILEKLRTIWQNSEDYANKGIGEGQKISRKKLLF